MTALPNANGSSMKKSILVITSVLLFFIIIICSSVFFASLMSVEGNQYDNPTRSQIEYFLECCELGNLPIDSADYLMVSKSPHKSDCRMVLVFNGDVTKWWDGFLTYNEGRPYRLPNNNTMTCSAEKQISTFVWAGRVASNGENKSILSVSNISGENIDYIDKLNSIP